MTGKLYPDNNVTHRCRETWSPGDFDVRIRARNSKLALGLHVIYELARAFLSGRNVEAVKASCGFLAEITEIEFAPPLARVLHSELHYAETRLSLLTVMEPLNQVSTRFELRRLQMGEATAAVDFISKREARVEVLGPALAVRNRDLLRGRLSEHPEARAQRRNFVGFKEQVLALGLGIDVLRQMTAQHGFRVRDATYEAVLAKPDDFPVLTTFLNCQWHMLFVAVMHGVDPSDDAADDLRHLVESARCDAFVTDDQKLLKRVPLLSPCRPGLSWVDFKAAMDSVS